MQTKLNETVLAECSLRYVRGEADKLHECYLTPTKLYFSRKGTVEVTALQNISNVTLLQRLNWGFLIIGLLIIALALTNYKFGVFPEKDARITTAAVSPAVETPAVDPATTHGLTSPEELFKAKDTNLTAPAELFVKADQSKLAEAEQLKLVTEWEESKNYISFGIGMVGAIFLYFGFKKSAYLQIVTNTQVILLRVYTISDEFNKFYHALLSRVGLTNTSK